MHVLDYQTPHSCKTTPPSATEKDGEWIHLMMRMVLINNLSNLCAFHWLWQIKTNVMTVEFNLYYSSLMPIQRTVQLRVSTTPLYVHRYVHYNTDAANLVSSIVLGTR